jgi:hypothetical protein
MGMTEEMRRILSRLLEASAEDRREAADALFDSLHDEPIERDEQGRPVLPFEEQWLEEIRRRQGLNRPLIDGKQVMADARAKLAAMSKARGAKGQ